MSCHSTYNLYFRIVLTYILLKPLSTCVAFFQTQSNVMTIEYANIVTFLNCRLGFKHDNVIKIYANQVSVKPLAPNQMFLQFVYFLPTYLILDYNFR